MKTENMNQSDIKDTVWKHDSTTIEDWLDQVCLTGGEFEQADIIKLGYPEHCTMDVLQADYAEVIREKSLERKYYEKL